MNVQVVVAADGEALAAQAAARVVEAGREAVGRRGTFALALSGGTTPTALYRLLADQPWRDALPWPQVQVFFGDERCVPPDHPESNYGMARRTLLAGVSPGAVWRMAGEDPPEVAALQYELRLRQQLGPAGELDLVLLGVGPEGHTASLFPGSWALWEERRWVAAPYVDKLGAYRLTLTVPVLRRARRVLVLAQGEGKREVLHRVLNGPWEPDRYPLQRVLAQVREAVLLVDRAAAPS